MYHFPCTTAALPPRRSGRNRGDATRAQTRRDARRAMHSGDPRPRPRWPNAAYSKTHCSQHSPHQ